MTLLENGRGLNSTPQAVNDYSLGISSRPSFINCTFVSDLTMDYPEGRDVTGSIVRDLQSPCSGSRFCPFGPIRGIGQVGRDDDRRRLGVRGGRAPGLDEALEVARPSGSGVRS